MTPITIPTLSPWGLEVVPEAADFFPWRDRVLEARFEVQYLCAYGDDAHDAAFYQTIEQALCREDPARWIAFWLYIEEPRLHKGESPIKPFVPFAFQVELAQWWVEKTSSPEKYDGFVSKSRGLGASWIFAAMATWAWLYRPWRGLFVSRKEDLVDQRGNLDSLFGKIDFILEQLPKWMLPEGFNFDIHRQKNFLKHPDNPAHPAAIVGEATTAKTARGARATYIFYDEASFIKDWKVVFGTGAGTTEHRWSVSSESFEEGSDWWDMWHAAQDQDPGCVRELNWRLNPYLDDYWYGVEKSRWVDDPAGFMREYERNPFTDDTWIYPTVRFIKSYEEAPFPDSDFPFYDPNELLLVGIDPGRADDTAIVYMQFSGDIEPRTARWIDSYSANLQPAEYYASILTGIEPFPNTELYGVAFDPYAREIMAWMRSLPWEGRMRVFCDPTGSQIHMSGNMSFTDRILVESKRLRSRAALECDWAKGRKVVPVVPLYEELFKHNAHDRRRLEMRKLLMHSVFASRPGARRLKRALEQYRFSNPGRQTTSQPSPLHDSHSHLASAAEYIATFCSIGLGKVKPRRDREKKVA